VTAYGQSAFLRQGTSTRSTSSRWLRFIAHSELARAMSFVAISALVGPVLGPVAGGLIVGYSRWRLISSLNVSHLICETDSRTSQSAADDHRELTRTVMMKRRARTLCPAESGIQTCNPGVLSENPKSPSRSRSVKLLSCSQIATSVMPTCVLGGTDTEVHIIRVTSFHKLRRKP
jgi:hypothetical protein